VPTLVFKQWGTGPNSYLAVPGSLVFKEIASRCVLDVKTGAVKRSSEIQTTAMPVDEERDCYYLDKLEWEKEISKIFGVL
jgi:hypothetical protein